MWGVGADSNSTLVPGFGDAGDDDGGVGAGIIQSGSVCVFTKTWFISYCFHFTHTHIPDRMGASLAHQPSPANVQSNLCCTFCARSFALHA